MERVWTVIVLKADVIQYALTEAQLDPTKEAIIMVGDRMTFLVLNKMA